MSRGNEARWERARDTIHYHVGMALIDIARVIANDGPASRQSGASTG